MRRFFKTFPGLLLATSALFTPALALAQDEAAAEAAAPEDEAVEEIVVLGRYIPEPMRQTSEVSAIVSAEDLVRTGDDNAAAALSRVTGLSISQGRFVYVRGLGERYSSARLNGSPLPSPEPLQRVVPLDLFPSSILSTVVVQKTYSANYPGEFGGGIIDLRSTVAPADPFFELSFSTGGNTETALQEGLIYYGSRTDFTGFDDGTRDLPTPVANAIATGNRIVAGPNFTDAELQQIGWSLLNAPLNLLQTQDYIPLNFGVELNGGRSFELDNGAIGLIGVLGYSNDWRSKSGIQQEGVTDLGELVPQRDFEFRSTENNVGWDALVGLSYYTGEQAVKWTNLYVRRTTKEARSRDGYDFSAPGDGFVRDDYTAWYERELFNSQLVGDHRLGDWDIEWRASYATTTRNAPYEKSIRYSIDAIGPFHNTQSTPNRTSFSELTDEVLSGGVDFSYSIPLSDARDVEISFGIEGLENTRDAITRDFTFKGEGLDDAFTRQRVDYLFSDFNIGPGLLEIVEVTGASGAAAYEASLEVRAAYAQVKADVFPLVSATLGLRYEEAEQSVEAIELFGGVSPFAPTLLENDYLLPAATITWNFAEDMQLRFGASRTIGRPQFRELAPQQYTDPDSDRLFIGNPYLTDSELLNIDGRFEWYFDRGQYFTISAFYKDIDRPVESSVNDAGDQLQQTYINAPRAILYGTEVEGKKYFESPLSGDFFENKRWLIQANYTYTKSELRVEDDDVAFPLSSFGAPVPALIYFTDGATLQGQSEHLANLQFGWEDESAQSQATLLVTYASERSIARGRPGEPDILNEPGVFLDFVYRKDFIAMGQDLQLSVEARNLLGEDFNDFQERNGRVEVNKYDLGQALSIGLKARF